MVLIFSTNANNSEEIKKEMALASQSHLMVIPVRAEDVLPSEDFTYELATRQWIDMFNDWEEAIEQLGAQIDLAVPREEGEPQTAAGSSAPNPAAPKKKMLPLFAGIAVLLLSAGAAAFWLGRPSPPPPQPAPSAPRVAQQQPAPPAPSMDPAKLESDLWDSVKDSGDAAALNSYLAKYPGGMFAAAAKAKLAALNKPAPVKAAKAAAPPPPAPTRPRRPRLRPFPQVNRYRSPRRASHSIPRCSRPSTWRDKSNGGPERPLKCGCNGGPGPVRKYRPGIVGLFGRPRMGAIWRRTSSRAGCHYLSQWRPLCRRHAQWQGLRSGRSDRRTQPHLSRAVGSVSRPICFLVMRWSIAGTAMCASASGRAGS